MFFSLLTLSTRLLGFSFLDMMSSTKAESDVSSLVRRIANIVGVVVLLSVQIDHGQAGRFVLHNLYKSMIQYNGVIFKHKLYICADDQYSSMRRSTYNT